MQRAWTRAVGAAGLHGWFQAILTSAAMVSGTRAVRRAVVGEFSRSKGADRRKRSCTRAAAWIGITLGAIAPAVADGFSGFSGVEQKYVVSPDRVCSPLAVAAGEARGVPQCAKAGTETIARLSVKKPAAMRGDQASLRAAHTGREISIQRLDGTKVVRWQSLDPIVRIEGLYVSAYEQMVAVAFTVRRGGAEVADVVGFALAAAAAAGPVAPTAAPAAGATRVSSVPADPALDRIVAKAKKAKGKKALALWDQALAIDAKSSEALFGRAATLARLKRSEETIAVLQRLAESDRVDAIELLVAARFDTAFAALRSDARFRAAVGYERGAASTYERLMGKGGVWIQDGTSCDTANVDLALSRDRSFRLRIHSKCSGMSFDDRFRGTWKVGADTLELVFPKHTLANTLAPSVEAVACAISRQADEDAVQCRIDEDLQFTLLPSRR